ncbi:HslU--HslV peptidase ATPase subunit [Sulfurospirillum sp. hDNRA2]|uniref:HslU--HslV peptidase ATPase subunit n=1 Tax=Sulfurospirillum sp. hDNRA2 TaxID=3237298 RepID=UPI000B32BFDD|nr:HslU--HslV peptidase ATPase subunit [Sulfurospirillum sp. DNRA8]MCP3651256.1 HslU--HslV peptidase ATPase subunit [Sulfurospirillum sp. DNRA8]MCR1810102.1 HslU--HslV peptidase ATPase subunit [Sulfurospirillum sp. DNRA8]
MNLTPKQIVAYLDEYIIGQTNAKKAIAIALRNRYRRLLLEGDMVDEVMPKNILMIGSTGVGKTEIARRMAKMLSLPFVKVEASKYTEVGFVGRDVESMVRDLMMASINLVKAEHREKNQETIALHVEKIIIEKLLPPLPKGVSEEKKAEYERSFEKMRQKLRDGELDELKIEIELSQGNNDLGDSSLPPEMVKVQESFIKILGTGQSSIKKEMSVKDAKEALKLEASEKLLDMEAIKSEARDRAQNGGIIFIDEIDKIAVSSSQSNRSDPSKEGVQRDLLPIVEGSDVTTKFGTIKTDHVLFISAGAFHLSKPSDLIPELQGRFPLRVELNALSEEVLFQILTQPKNSLLRQYQALLKTEGVELVFEEDAIRAIAKIAQTTNERTEDIGARRLHTVIEKVLEEISYSADEHQGETLYVTKELVHQKLDAIVENEDSSRYIL